MNGSGEESELDKAIAAARRVQIEAQTTLKAQIDEMRDVTRSMTENAIAVGGSEMTALLGYIGVLDRALDSGVVPMMRMQIDKAAGETIARLQQIKGPDS